ncbi:sensor histidine kinase [Lewinella sp. IMCC34191]|uniref:sensor histidine kinase n=1 Tax=Lewinella sp. IMCC34191 TaxID=2259172 RepID=UPI001300885C|nr:sensor histidine kinase [Lewinella sp. IMCC34191]
MSADRLIFLLVVWLSPFPASLIGNDEIRFSDQDEDHVLVFEEAERHLRNGQLDSAAYLLTGLYESLVEQGKEESPFGLWVRLRRSRAWERGRGFTQALSELLEIVALAKPSKVADIRAEAYMLIALIHEQQHDARHTEKYLQAAREIIRKHELTGLESKLAIRFASYHRLFGEKETALRYSHEALDDAIASDNAHDETVAHLVISLLHRDQSPEISLDHLMQASDRLHEIDDPILSLVVSLQLSEISFRDQNYVQALAYNDQAMTRYQSGYHDTRSEAFGYLDRIYDGRAEILSQMGRNDSAYHYLALGREVELAEMRESNNIRIAEIEAEYSDEKKQQLIAEQQAEIDRRERATRWNQRFLLLIAVVLLILGVSYIRVRGANRLLAEQSLEIQDQNDRLEASLVEQQLLRAELHHRIKNNLQIIIGLLDLQSDTVHDNKDRGKLESLMKRVHGMATIHDILYRESSLHQNSLQRYIEGICEQYRQTVGEAEDFGFEVDLPEVSFSPDTLIPLGIIVNELLMNSGKHALTTGNLRINISMDACPTGGYRLTYRDNGPGYPSAESPEKGGSLGMYLLAGLSRQLGGYVETKNDGGAVTAICFGTIQTPSEKKSQMPIQNKNRAIENILSA